MILADALYQHSGIKFVTDKLKLLSPAGRKRMLLQNFMTNSEEIAAELNGIEQILTCIHNPEYKANLKIITDYLSQLHDIESTANNLGHKAVLDDIELFEIKRFALYAEEIRLQLEKIHFKQLEIPYLSEVIQLLDPENNRTAHFYIYSAYDNKLAELRQQHKEIEDQQSTEALQLYQECMENEDAIRKQLSEKLWDFHSDIVQALQATADLDFFIARAYVAIELGLNKPKIGSEITSYTDVFHPLVKYVLENEHARFQPWTISMQQAPILITGANMAGKTVLLKTIGLNQYLFQYGFYVAAKEAEIVAVDQIMVSFEDEQSELKGLSSFAAEMLNIQKMISKARDGKNILALVDEPARTTNPQEGIAIANALLDMFEILKIRSLVTTHYSGLHTNCRKLRVKGLSFDKNTEAVSTSTINQYMDYSLLEVMTDEVPQEALLISKILGIDAELIQKAQKYTEINQKK